MNRNIELAIRKQKRHARSMERLRKNRVGISIFAIAILALAAIFLAPVTLGVSLFALKPVVALGAKSIVHGKMLLGMAAAASPRAQFPRNRNANYGIQTEPVPGIALSSTLMSVSHDCDRRYHNFDYQVVAVNYSGGAGKAVTMITAGHTSTGATATITTNGFGVPVTAAVVAGGTGTVATGDLVSIADATGAGAQWTVTASGGVISALTYVANSATPTAIDPRLVVSDIQLIVGTTAVIQTTAAMEIFRALFNFQPISYGHLPIYFTEPWRNLTDARATSWDMAGQSTFTTKFTMVPGYTSVGIAATMDFDYIRNTVAGEIDQVTYQSYVASGSFPAPRLQIISRKLLTPTLNGGNTLIQPALIPTGWPILRMFFFPATPNTLTQILMKADTQIIQQGYIGAQNGGAVVDQMREQLIQRGFNLTLTNSGTSIAPDYSYVADYDQRVQNKLKVSNLGLQLTSTGGQQGLTILQEVLETSYS